MISWLERKIYSWGIAKQRKELETWLNLLISMNSDEIGALVAGATHMRHGLEKTYHVNLLDPIVTSTVEPDLIFKLHGLIKEYQSRGDNASAASVMVWLHTLRCGTSLELRQLGRSLWRELERGFQFVDASAQNIYNLSGMLLETSGYNQFPVGLEPEITNLKS